MDEVRDPEVKPWVISSNWLTDGVKYNEWMNEEDYEKEDQEDQAEDLQAPQLPSQSLASPQGEPEASSQPNVAVNGAEGSANPSLLASQGADSHSQASKKSQPPPAAAQPDKKRTRISLNLKKRTAGPPSARPTTETSEPATEMEADTPQPAADITMTGAVPAAAVDLSTSGAPGKRSEQDPFPDGVLGNVPPAPAVARSTDTDHSPRVVEADAVLEHAEGEEKDDGHVEAPRDAPQGETTPHTSEHAAQPPEEEMIESTVEEAYRLHAQRVAQQYLAVQTQEVIVPSYAKWFDLCKIHPIEKRALPEFFSPEHVSRSKNPGVYRSYRDFMVHTFRLNPSEHLCFTACRRSLGGDVGAMMRVHAFLEQWGLINYLIDPDTKASALAPPLTGRFEVALDAPGFKDRALLPSKGKKRAGEEMEKDTSSESQVRQDAGQDRARVANLELRQTIYRSTAEAQQTSGEEGGPTASNIESKWCATCGTDCSQQRFQAVNVSSFFLCPNCYHEGKFPTALFSGSFIKVTSGSASTEATKDGKDEWSDEEVLRLLEGLEMHDDDWGSVASHVETRSREACILKFLSLPIEDVYLSGPSSVGGDAINLTKLTNGKSSAGPGDAEGARAPPTKPTLDRATPLPFIGASNPVMSLVAFLASAVSPAVASAAAQAALGELTDGVRLSQTQDTLQPLEEGSEEQGKKPQGQQHQQQPPPQQPQQSQQPHQPPEQEEEHHPSASAHGPDAMDLDHSPLPPSERSQEQEPPLPPAAAHALEVQSRKRKRGGLEGHASESGTREVDYALRENPTLADSAPATPAAPAAAAAAAATSNAGPANALGTATTTLPRSAVERAAAVALGAAAAKAHVLAALEERECQRLVARIVEAQMRKMDIKLEQVECLEDLLSSEQVRLVQVGQEVAQDRARVGAQLKEVEALLKQAQADPSLVAPGPPPPGAAPGPGGDAAARWEGLQQQLNQHSPHPGGQPVLSSLPTASTGFPSDGAFQRI